MSNRSSVSYRNILAKPKTVLSVFTLLRPSVSLEDHQKTTKAQTSNGSYA